MIYIERLSKSVEDVLHKDLASQYRGVCFYLDKIESEIKSEEGDEACDLLNYCEALIDSNTKLLFNDYLSLFNFKNGYDSEVVQSFYVLAHYQLSVIDGCLSDIKNCEGIDCFDIFTIHSNIFKMCRKVYGFLSEYEKKDVNEDRYKLLKLKIVDDREIKFLRLTYLVLLYIALKNELERIKEQAHIEGVSLPITENTPRLPENGEKQQEGAVMLPDELNTPKAKYMLKELIKAGYCDEKYNWNSDKWGYKKDVMALACFAVEATKYLNLKRLMYVEKKTDKEKKATQWNVFEILFNYRGKKYGKNQLKSKRDIYMKENVDFDPPEMDEIKAFFKRLEKQKQPTSNPPATH